jgi:hypothetical protein
MERCEPAVARSGTLGETELDDVKNRAAWHTCVVQHEAAVECFEALKEKGYVQDR